MYDFLLEHPIFTVLVIFLIGMGGILTLAIRMQQQLRQLEQKERP